MLRSLVYRNSLQNPNLNLQNDMNYEHKYKEALDYAEHKIRIKLREHE